ncbi:peptide deformylase [Patescibacteria group bacterium]|nr:peptide deformylase [Patescibacteria group bacterium]MBU1015510.1 peptide deformylase [Patescibacteria group bacterium]MBU1685433.1 peptide deformylase [Patescibacteria group bacterium]MBU1938394.1 peptide deformylase [Patescibacteria group bacterium]
MILDITKGKDNPILRQVSPKQGPITKKTLKLLKDMEDSMIATNGVGIAAPQVGMNTRIAHITINKTQVFTIINPEIIAKSKETEEDTEGCLSLPGKWGPVARAKELTLRFTDLTGKKRVMKFKDFEARIVQHEVDHLNGTLFIDHVPEGMLEIEGGLAL